MMTENGIDTGKEDGPKKNKRDWKGMAAMVGALLAVLGFIWNKVDALYDREEAVGVQRVSYETLAARVNAICDRLEFMEQLIASRRGGRRHVRADKVDAETLADTVIRRLKALMDEKPAEKPEPKQSDPVIGTITAEVDAAMEFHEASEAKKEDKPVEPYKRLPSFQAVQKKATEVEGDQ